MAAKHRIGVSMLVVALSVMTAGFPAVATSADDTVLHDDCWDVVSWHRVPRDAVRPHVPARFTLIGEASGLAVVFVRSGACARMTVTGVTSPTTFSHFAALVEPITPTDNICSVPGAPRYTLCGWYVFEMATDNPRLASWVRANTTLDSEVVFAPAMSASWERAGTILRYRFELPSAASPFSMSGTMSAETTIPWCEAENCIWVDHYLQTDSELVHIGGTSDLRSHAGSVTVQPMPGSLMASMFGPLERRESTTPVTFNRWREGYWVKAIHHP